MTDYGNPDVDPSPADHLSGPEATALPDDSDYRGDVRNAIETALAATPKDARTVEAKAEWLHEHIERAGWVLTHPEPGETPVMLVPGQQVVEVPEGATVSIHPPGEFALYGPAVSGNDELGFLAVVCEHLARMAPDARERCTAYLTDRFGPTAPVPVGRPSWLDVTRPPGHDLPLRTGGVIGRAAQVAMRISE